MYKHKRTDFIETTLKPALLENYESKTDSLGNFRSTFERHKSRLAVVRETKARQLQEMMDGEGDLNDLDADLYSDASSMMGSVARSETGSMGSTGSTLSAYTAYSDGKPRKQGRAGKNKRKGERKKHSLREGSRNEDIALMEALALIIKNVDNLRDDVGVLLRMLVKFEFETEAETLQNDLQSLISLLQNSVNDIWPLQSSDDKSASQMYGPQATTNSIVASMTQLGGPQRSFTRDDLASLVPPKLSEDQKWKLHLLDPR